MDQVIEAGLPIDGMSGASVWNVNLIVTMIILLKQSSLGQSWVSEQQGFCIMWRRIRAEIET